MHKTHGMTDSPEYAIWCAMKQRCADAQNPYYGGKGITVCERWSKSFEGFHEDMGEKPADMSIDRIDFTKGYSKLNCKWSTAQEQSENRSNVIRITIDGETKILSRWLENLPISYPAYKKRLSRGWSIEKSLTTPPRKW